MRIIAVSAAIVGMINLAFNVCALGQPVENKKPFTNETTVSLVNTSGNSDALSLSGKNEMRYRFTPKWQGSWVIGAVYNETGGVKETERYYTDLRGDYAINQKWYAYGLGSWLQDKFAGFDHRVGIGPGLGYRFFDGPKNFLALEGGVNYSYEDYTALDEKEDHFIEGRLYGRYEWVFRKKTKFSQGVEYLKNLEDNKAWKINAESALQASLTEVLALKISFSVFYNNDPQPSDLKQTDTILATSLVIGF